MKDFSVHESEDGEVAMGGRLTIENAADVRGVLLDALRRHRQIKITVRQQSVTDLSFLQILCSLHRSAMRADKTVKQGIFSDSFVSAIVGAGFSRSKGCGAGKENNCLWNIGGEQCLRRS